MNYMVDVFKHTAEININANSAAEAEEKVQQMLQEDDCFILKIRAEMPTILILKDKIGVMEG